MREQRSFRWVRAAYSRKINQCVIPITAALGWAAGTYAATSTWTGAGDGHSWTSPGNWSSLPPNTSPGNDLVFGGGTVGTIQLGGNELANSLTFNAGFTLDPLASTNTLTITTGSVTVGSSVSATINSILTGTNGLSLSGSGILTLSATNTYAGLTPINSGTLVASGEASLPGSLLTVGTSGTLMLTATAQPVALPENVGQNGNLTVASNSTATMASGTGFHQNAGTLTIGGTLNTGSDAFQYNGGTISGTVTMGSTSAIPTLTLAAGAGNSGNFQLIGEGILLSAPAAIAVQSAQTLTLAPTSSSGSIQAFADIDNAGAINLQTSSTSQTQLITSGTIYNTGTLTTSAQGSATTTTNFITGVLNNSGIVNLTATTQIDNNVTNNGTFDVAGGQTVSLSSATSFTQNSGTLAVAGTLSLGLASFSDLGGTVTGTVTMGANGGMPTLTIGSGTSNSGSFILSGAGAVVAGGSPLSIPSAMSISLQPNTNTGQFQASGSVNNAGQVSIIGSSTSTATLNLSTATFTNSGSLTTSVTATPSSPADFITAALNDTTGTVSINASTQMSGSITNNGTFDVASGQTLTMEGTTGSFTQNAGTLAVSGSLVMLKNNFNDNGGAITGTVTMGISGTMPTLTIGSSAGNSGNFLFTSGGYLNATGTVGIPSGMSITFNSTTTYDELEAVFSMPLNNAGTIVINTGGISNFAEFATSGLTNTGTFTTSGGSDQTTLVNDTITNLGTVNLNHPTALIGDVTNNGTFEIGSGVTVTFNDNDSYGVTENSGTMTMNGFLDIPDSPFNANGGTIILSAGKTGQTGELECKSINFTGTDGTALIESGTPGTGQLQGFVELGGANVTFSIGAGSAPAQVQISAPIKDGAVTKSGGGVLVFSGANTYAGGTTVTAGTLVIASAASLPSGSVSVSGGTLQLASSIGLTNMTSLSIAGTGTFDVNNNHVLINYGSGSDPITSIAALLATGYANGAWNGAGGITSTAAAANSTSYGLGYADSADPGNPAGLSSGTIEIKYTLLGDANLDGIVNGIDFGILAANFNHGVTGWDKGDFNYDNVVNGIDFGQLAANFNKGASGASFGPGPLSDPALVAFAQANGLMADVPEPSTLSLAAVALGALSFRKRRIRSVP
jgi:fibronectin-binding autotransporter adhesin